MIFFSWKKILRRTGVYPRNIIAVIELLGFKRMPKNKYDPMYKYVGKDFSGISYLLNPEELITNKRRWTQQEIAEYIGLASFRSYPFYRQTGRATLPLANNPASLSLIINNRLLSIVDDEVRFLYEDIEVQRRNKK